MDKERVKEIFGEYWDGIKDKSLWNLSNKEFENIAYKQVAEEIKQGDYKPHIQLKAVEKAKGNKEVIESLYIQFRVSEVTDELKAIASDYEAKVNAERLELEIELKAKKKAYWKAKKEAVKAYKKAKKEAEKNEMRPNPEEKIKTQSNWLFLTFVILFLVLFMIYMFNLT